MRGEPAAAQEAQALELRPPAGLEDEVSVHRQLGDHPLPQPILGDSTDTGGDRGRSAAPGPGRAAEQYLSVRGPDEPGEQTRQRALAIPRDAGDADDLMRVHGEAGTGETAAAWHIDAAQLEDRRPRPLDVPSRQAYWPADHRLGDRGRVRAMDGELGDLAARSQHDDAPAQAHHLVELVADEEDRQPSGGQPLQRGEQPLGLLRSQHGRGLVQDQDTYVAVESLEDLDPLPLAHGQRGDGRGERYLEARSGDEVGKLAPRRTPMAAQAP